MGDRRQALKTLVAGSGVGAAASVLHGAEPSRHHKQGKHKAVGQTAKANDCECVRSGCKVFPNVVVRDHENHASVFYNDLIRDRTVIVSFFSIAGHAAYPVSDNLAKVADAIGKRLGRDTFIYSITVDPENDTADALANFAAKFNVRPGWKFLTGESEALAVVRDAFFIHPAAHHAMAGHDHKHAKRSHADCMLGLLRYGSDAAGIWGSVAAKAQPAQIAERLTWLRPKPVPDGPARRKGPRPLAETLARRRKTPRTKES